MKVLDRNLTEITVHPSLTHTRKETKSLKNDRYGTSEKGGASFRGLNLKINALSICLYDLVCWVV